MSCEAEALVWLVTKAAVIAEANEGNEGRLGLCAQLPLTSFLPGGLGTRPVSYTHMDHKETPCFWRGTCDSTPGSCGCNAKHVFKESLLPHSRLEVVAGG